MNGSHATSPPKAPNTLTAVSRAARWVAGAVLVVLALALARLGGERLEGEKLWRQSRTVARAKATQAREREILLRQALEHIPGHAEIQRELGTFLISLENTRAARGEFANMSLENIREGLALLDASRETFIARYLVSRTRGESALMFGDLNRRLGRTEDAEQWNMVALADLVETARFLPRPRNSPERLNHDLILAAQRVGRDHLAVIHSHRMDAWGQRWLFAEQGFHREPDIARSQLLMGDHPAMLRELRLGLWSRPGDARLLRLLEAAGRNAALGSRATSILRELRAQNRLGPEGIEVLRNLQAPAAAPPGEPAHDPTF